MSPVLPLLAAALLLVTQPAPSLMSPPAAVIADPAPDPVHPAKLIQVRYPSGGVAVPARLFRAAGVGAHPTVLLLHGFPGTELNLDLARTLQRDGWNVLAIHYRGVWGGPGKFSFSHTIEDARAALAWLRSPATVATYAVRTDRIVVLGHSMGGFDTVMLGEDAGVAGYVLISAADLGRQADRATVAVRDGSGTSARGEDWADDASFTNMSLAEMAADMTAHAAEWDWRRRAAMMHGRPVLIVSSDDGLGGDADAAEAAVRAAGGPSVIRVALKTDHSYSDHRIALESVVVNWLNRTFPR